MAIREKKTREPLRAFHGSAAIKREYVARVQAHRAFDQIRQGLYWDRASRVLDGDELDEMPKLMRQKFIGCAVGCTIHSGKHAKYEDVLGIPVELAWLEDGIFEGIDGEEEHDLMIDFPLAFLDSIEPGADLTGVVPAIVDMLKAEKLLKEWQIEQMREELQRGADARSGKLPRRYLEGEGHYMRSAITQAMRESSSDRIISDLLLLLREAPIVSGPRKLCRFKSATGAPCRREFHPGFGAHRI
jgi:hypothetical protein